MKYGYLGNIDREVVTVAQELRRFYFDAKRGVTLLSIIFKFIFTMVDIMTSHNAYHGSNS
jgi:hypothetical protein